MGLAWITLTEQDVQRFMTQSVVGASNELDVDGNSRASNLLPVVTDRIRGAVVTGNRVPVSLTPGAIPPESRWHALCLAVFALVESQPVLGEFALKDGFTRRWEEAEKWVRSVASGDQTVTPPLDPDPDNTPAYTWGDVAGENTAGVGSSVDMTTDGPLPTQPPPGPIIMWQLSNGVLQGYDPDVQAWFDLQIVSDPPQVQIANGVGVSQWRFLHGRLEGYDPDNKLWGALVLTGALPNVQLGVTTNPAPGQSIWVLTSDGTLKGFHAVLQTWYAITLVGVTPQIQIRLA
jgi:hypothetical protein